MTPHAEYLSLGDNEEQRRLAYQALFLGALSEDRLAEIRAYVQQQRALGSSKFQAQIEAVVGRCVRTRPAHRPVAEDLIR